MAADRLSMRKLREILRLSSLGHSRRAIGRSLNISHVTVGTYLDRAAIAGVDWPACTSLDDATLETKLVPPGPGPTSERPIPNWAEVHRELQRKGVTLRLSVASASATCSRG